MDGMSHRKNTQKLCLFVTKVVTITYSHTVYIALLVYDRYSCRFVRALKTLNI